MAGITELIRSEYDNSLSFGDYTLKSKTKLSNYRHQGDIYKVKTFNEMTRLEKNDAFVYESKPGTAVYNMKYSDEGIEFYVEGAEDIQLTLELKESAEYEITADNESLGIMKTNLGGKLTFGLELNGEEKVCVKIRQI